MKVWIVIILLVVLSACGTRTKSQEGEELAIIQNAQNQRDYEQSVILLESYLAKHPDDQQAQAMYLSALLGSAQFESGKTSTLIEQMTKNKIKKDKPFLPQLKKMVSNIPDLNPTQLNNLNKAILLYNRKNIEPSKISADDNLKYGTLNGYAFLIHFKKDVYTIDSLKIGNTTSENDKESIKNIIQSFANTRSLYLKAINHFGHSLPKIQKMGRKMSVLNDRLFSKKALSKYYQLVIERYKPYLKSEYLKGNGMAQMIIAKSTTFIDDEEYSENFLTDVVGPLKGDKKDISLRIERLKLLGEVFLDQEVQNEELNNSALQISKNLKEFDFAANFLAALNNNDPEILFNSTEKLLKDQLPILKSAFDIIVTDFDNSKQNDEIKSETNILINKVNIKGAKLIVENLMEDLDENFSKEIQEFVAVFEDFTQASVKLTLDDLKELNKQASEFTKSLKEELLAYSKENQSKLSSIKSFFEKQLAKEIDILAKSNAEKLKQYSEKDRQVIYLMYLDLAKMIRDDKARFNFINENIELFRKPDRKTKKAYRRLRALARLFWNKEVGARAELISEVETDIDSLKGFDFRKKVFNDLRKGDLKSIIEKAKVLKEYNLDLASRVYVALIKDLEEDEIYLIAEPDLEFLMQKVQKDALIELLAELQKKYEATLNKDEVRLTEIFKRAEIKINSVIEVEGLKVDDFLEDCMDELDSIKTDVRAEESKGSGEVADRIDTFFETLK